MLVMEKHQGSLWVQELGDGFSAYIGSGAGELHILLCAYAAVSC